MKQPTLTYVYEFNGHKIEVTRRLIGTAYPRNGNVHNPTKYYQWSSKVDGVSATSSEPSRAVAYEYARAKALGIPYRNDEGVARRCVNVRSYVLVADEMQANYRGRVKA